MALLEQVIVEAEQAQMLVQDDGRVTDENDRRAIKDHLMRIRSIVMELEKTLGTKILTPESRPTTQGTSGPTLTGIGVHGLKKKR